MKHGSLFSGIGGFDLAAEWMGWENVFQVENDKFCNKVLKKNFPKVKRYGDIKEFKGQPGQCDIISGGFPCQKYSTAGKQDGNEILKSEMLRIIFEIMPSWLIIENVYGFINKKFAKEHNLLCKYLENLGYETQTFDIDASSVSLQTMERHIWIIATTFGIGLERGKKIKNCNNGIKRKFQGNDTEFNTRWNISESRFCNVAKRLSRKLAKYQREKLIAAGNAIPPRVAFEIFKAIDYDTKNQEHQKAGVETRTHTDRN